MDATEQVAKFSEFFETNLYQDMLRAASKGEKHLCVPFPLLARFSVDLAEELLDDPDNVLKAATHVIEQMDLGSDTKGFELRFFDLPPTTIIKIRDIRAKHLNKFHTIEGVVRQKSDVRPQVTSARFECPSCGNIIPVLQVDTKFREPTMCAACGRKGQFRILHKELVDMQKITLEESSEEMDGGEQPKRLAIFLKNDLVSPMTEKKTNPGSKILVTGIIKEISIALPTGGKSTRYDLICETNHVEPVHEEFTNIIFEPQEIERIKELSKESGAFELLAKSLAPTIYGHDRIKEALLLQLFGGVKKTSSDGVSRRGDIHVLLIGDPGSGKSQLIKRVSKVAPKARFVSGKGSSGAGLTASVVKDDFMRGWALEAGALVLANNGIACLDELDKMTPEDTSAMHEALEQQCYHRDTVLQFADGSEQSIGSFVESILSTQAVIQGHNCLICREVDKSIITTDGSRMYPTKITAVSKHIATKHMYRIAYSNGRSIIVTPEHPVFVIHDGEIRTVRADELRSGSVVPAARYLPIPGCQQMFNTSVNDVYNPRSSQHINVPVHNDVHIYRLIGHLLAEGSREINRKKLIGVNFTNKDEVLLDDVKLCMQEVFGLQPYEQQRIDHNEPRMMLRYISRELAVFFQREFPEVLTTSGHKAIPSKLMGGARTDIAALLQTMFEGDGHVSVKPRTLRIGYGTNSIRLAQQTQDLLLRFGIRSSLTHHKNSYKVNITGYENIALFKKHIGFMNKVRQEKVSNYLLTKKEFSKIRTYKEIIPDVGKLVVDLMKKYGIRRVSKSDIGDMRHAYNNGHNISRSHLQQFMLSFEQKEIDPSDKELYDLLWSYAFEDISFERVTSIQKISSDHPWTYDITVEPTHCFISQGLILHNSVSISKANIQATLRCQTTVLAAANPKFGRFDQFDLIARQINLPSTLINRFDLIFAVKDLPNKEIDDKLASFILNLHKGDNAVTDDTLLDTQFLRKYIAYAKQNCFPELTDAALGEIKRYYVQMRSQGQGAEGVVSAIPISARQLEGLVRLAEASAKARLSGKVTKKDAQVAIDLTHYCLSQIGMDPETGKIDIDRITTGVTASQRSHISVVKEVISGLESAIGKLIPVSDLVREAEIKGVSESLCLEIIEKLKRSGDVFSPKQGFISKI